MKRAILAFFNDPLVADDAMSNLTEASYKYRQTQKNGQIKLKVLATTSTIQNALQILKDAKADKIFLV